MYRDGAHGTPGLTSGGGVDRVGVNGEILLGSDRSDRGEHGEDGGLTHCETGGTGNWGRARNRIL